MPETASRKLPYPSATAAPDVPTAIQQLAEKVDADMTTLYEDSGWIAIVPSDTRFSVGSEGMAYRRRSGIVHVQMHVNFNPTNARGVIATLPVGFRPTRTLWVILGNSGAPQTELRIQPNGQLVAVGTPGNTTGAVGYISYPVD